MLFQISSGKRSGTLPIKLLWLLQYSGHGRICAKTFSLALKYCYTADINSAPVGSEKMEKWLKVDSKIDFFQSCLILWMKYKVHIVCYSIQIDKCISNSHILFLHIMDLAKCGSKVNVIPKEIRQSWPIILNLGAFIYWFPIRVHIISLKFTTSSDATFILELFPVIGAFLLVINLIIFPLHLLSTECIIN